MLNFPKSIIEWLLPYTCILCGGSAQKKRDLCCACLKDLPAYHNGCPRCGFPVTFSSLPCGRCLASPPPFHATHILFSYQGPIPRLITRLKFNHNLVIAKVLSHLFYEQIKYKWYQNKPYPDIIMPVPLHPERLKMRGYNQTLEIAKPLACQLRLPLNLHACYRSRATLPQTTLSAKARKQNVHHAFKVAYTLKGLHIAVLEDVITTGSTLNAMCEALVLQGARRIDIWCVARGMPVLPK